MVKKLSCLPVTAVGKAFRVEILRETPLAVTGTANLLSTPACLLRMLMN